MFLEDGDCCLRCAASDDLRAIALAEPQVYWKGWRFDVAEEVDSPTSLARSRDAGSYHTQEIVLIGRMYLVGYVDEPVFLLETGNHLGR